MRWHPWQEDYLVRRTELELLQVRSKVRWRRAEIVLLVFLVGMLCGVLTQRYFNVACAAPEECEVCEECWEWWPCPPCPSPYEIHLLRAGLSLTDRGECV